MAQPDRRRTGIKRSIFNFLSRHWLIWASVCFSIGILTWGGLNTLFELTNQEDFCISCHEMRDNVYPEYQKTIHYKNPSGVRATCPDCHVPRPWPHMVARKIGASNELLHKFLGDIDTREKFLAKRLTLAEGVWATMKATDSRECRNCHQFDYMDPKHQRPGAAKQHLTADQEGKTCIDCHKGIAHKLPEAFLAKEHERIRKEKIACQSCHPGMAKPAGEGWNGEF
jgi:cytochrome c-type protein NapC